MLSIFDFVPRVYAMSIDYYQFLPISGNSSEIGGQSELTDSLYRDVCNIIESGKNIIERNNDAIANILYSFNQSKSPL